MQVHSHHSSLKKWYAFLVAILSIGLQGLSAEDSPQRLPIVRDRDTLPGLYESHYSDATHGERVADLDEESIQNYFKSRQVEDVAAFDLDSENQKRVDISKVDENDRPILYVVGLPLFGEERENVMDLVNKLSGTKKKKFSDWVKDLFYLNKDKSETLVRPIGRPAGKWKLLQRMVYPMIWPSDMMPISNGVLKQGIQSVLISSALGLTIQLMVQLGEQGNIAKALAVVIPTVLVNFIQSAWTSLPRNWWQNYFKRATAIASPLVESVVERSQKSDRAARIFGSIAQQIWLTFFVTFNVYLVSRGNWDASLALLSLHGLKEFIIKKWPSMLMNIVWRTPVENALADYVEDEGNKGRSQHADVEAAKIRKFLTIFATNLWIYSTLTTMNLDFLGAKWNLGHAGLAIMALFGIKAWMKPVILRAFTKTGRCANELESLKQVEPLDRKAKSIP